MKYRILISAFVFLESGAHVYAQDNINSKLQSNAETYAEKDTNNSAQAIPEQKPEKQQQTDWPRNFIPSEKIKADSSVSFPVDI